MSKYNSTLLRPKCSRPIRNTQDRVKRIKEMDHLMFAAVFAIASHVYCLLKATSVLPNSPSIYTGWVGDINDLGEAKIQVPI